MSSFRKRFAFYLIAFLIWCLWMWSVTDGPQQPFALWLKGWRRWDAIWYERIWREGYGFDLRMLAFPPGYAMVVGLVSRIFQLPFGLAAMVVNLPSYFFAGVLATEFLAERFRVSWYWLFVFFLAAPVGFYAFATYSDAVFCCLLWALIPLAVKRGLSRDEFGTALLLAFVTPWIRITGYALVGWVFLRRWFVLSALVSLALWLTLNWWIAGDPFHFLKIQKSFIMPEGGLIAGIKYHFWDLSNPPPVANAWPLWEWIQVTILPLLSMGLFLGVAAWLAIKREFVLAITIISIMFFSRNQPLWRSVFRYDLPLMPLLAIPLLFNWNLRGGALQWIKRGFYLVFVLLGFALQGIFAWRLHAGHWAF